MRNATSGGEKDTSERILLSDLQNKCEVARSVSKVWRSVATGMRPLQIHVPLSHYSSMSHLT
ncbi:MAG: hypothetical protein AAGG44_13170, partial [Planctomycetota bacterium]